MPRAEPTAGLHTSAPRVAGPRVATVLAFLLVLLGPTPAALAAGGGAGTGDGEPGEAEEDHHSEPREHGDAHDKGHGAHSSALSEEPIPLQLEGFPERPKPFVELGNNFLGTGNIDPGFQLPTGAVWQPSLLGFGTWRNAVQTLDDDDRGERVTELRTRLDLFFNLHLTGTERLLVGFSPLQEDGRFTRYVFEGPDDGEFFDELDFEVTTLFFEGDFGEIFPNLSRDDFAANDYGFSVGRQPLIFQEGFLINDAIDSIGVTRNTLMPAGTSNFRTTFLAGWGDVHRAGVEDDDAAVFGVLTSTDFRRSTVDVDVVYVQSDGPLGDQVAGGVSGVQRFGVLNTTFRALASFGMDDGPAAIDDGFMLVSEISWTPHYSHDLVYTSAFVAIDDFVPPVRGAGIGGPLADLGLSFAGSGLGFPGPLSSEGRDVAGAVLGYQKFFDGSRRQMVFEVAGRVGLDDSVGDQVAGTVRWQKAFRKHYVFILDAFGGWRSGGLLDDDRSVVGGRVELLTKF